MSKPFKRYLVTSALPYANGPVHIGHLAGVYIPSDIYTRYLRLKGYDVISVCGSDEHGVPITIKARKEGVTPQQIVDRYHQLIKSSFEGLGMSFDIYSRTSSKTHAATASEFFRKLYDEGKFIERTSEQYYDEETQTFLADRYIVGTCPRCGNDRAYGDQELHLVMDNYATHKHAAVQKWMKRHKRFHFHFTPTSSSWLNQVERWFRDLTDKNLRRGIFGSVPELIASIESYLNAHNADPKPYVWTATAESILAKVRRARTKLQQVVSQN